LKHLHCDDLHIIGFLNVSHSKVLLLPGGRGWSKFEGSPLELGDVDSSRVANSSPFFCKFTVH